MLELIEADKNNRIALFPAPIGSTVFVVRKYFDDHCGITECILSGLHLGYEVRKNGVRRKEYMVLRNNGFSRHVPLDQMGKTVFLNKKEAKAQRDNIGGY